MPKQSLTKGSFSHPWAKGKARKLLCRVGAYCSNPFRFMVKDLCGGKQLVESLDFCVHFHWLAFAKGFHQRNETLAQDWGSKA